MTPTVPGTDTAMVIAPAQLGVGGLGQSAQEVVHGLESQSLRVTYLGGAPPTRGLRGLAARRPLRRWSSLRRTLDRRELARRAREAGHGSALVYAMPGFLPSPNGGATVLHQATRHPRVVRRAVIDARQEAGGGRGFMTATEARRLEAELMRADVIRVLSRRVGEELSDAGVASERLVLAYPGVDLSRFRPRVKRGGLRVAFVGGLALWKGVDLLAELAQRMRGQAEFTVAGGPACPWSRRVAQSAPLELDRDVSGLLSRSHALVLPSAAEGFGRVVLEAMASGCVPIVTPAVGAAEVVEELEPALVVPRGQFVSRVSAMLRDLPLDDLGRRGRELAEEFDRPRMARIAGERILAAVRRTGD